VSDLNRTIQTANQIIKHHTTTPVIYDNRIREKSGGILEGKLIKFLKELAEVKDILYIEKRNTYQKIPT
jgi:broad specificity phosphatase PhoE